MYTLRNNDSVLNILGETKEKGGKKKRKEKKI